jgi:hypothetical protein
MFKFLLDEFLILGWFGRTMYFIVLSLLILVLYLFGMETYYMIRPNCKEGIVVGKCYSPAHDVSGMIMVGKVMVPTTTHISDAWYLQVDGTNSWHQHSIFNINVTPQTFDSTTNGDFVNFKL